MLRALRLKTKFLKCFSDFFIIYDIIYLSYLLAMCFTTVRLQTVLENVFLYINFPAHEFDFIQFCSPSWNWNFTDTIPWNKLNLTYNAGALTLKANFSNFITNLSSVHVFAIKVPEKFNNIKKL